MTDVRVDFVTSGQEVLTGALRQIGGGLVDLAANALASAGSAFVDFAKDSFAGAIEAKSGLDALAASITRAGAGAPVTMDAALGLADTFKNLVGGSDDVVLAMQDVGLRFNQIGADVFPQFIQSAADMATSLKIDPVKAAELLGKTLQDISIDGVGSLGKLKAAGVQLTDAQEKQILAMVKAGDVAGAQKLIMDSLASTIGGSALAASETLAGQWAIFQETIADAGEGVMLELMPPLNALAKNVLPIVAGVVSDVTGALGGFIGMILAGDFGGAIDNLGEFETFQTIFKALGVSIYDLEEPFEAFMNGLIGLGDAFNWVVQAFSSGASIEQVLAGLRDFSWDDMFGPEVGAMIVGAIDAFNVFQETVTSVFTSFQPVVDAVVELWNGKLAPALATIFGDLTNGAPPAGDVFKSVMDGIKVAAGAFADFLVNVVIPGVGQLVDWFMANWPTIKATGESIMKGLQTAIQDVLNGIQAFWAEWGDEIVAAGEAVWTLITDTFKTFEKAFKGDWRGFGEDLRKAFDEAWVKIQAIVTTAVQAIMDMDWGEIGTNILKGIADGITSATHFIVEAAMAAAQAAFDAAKGFLGIQSPSKLFKSIGENMMLGWAQGINANAGLPAYATMGAAYATTISVGGIYVSGAGNPLGVADAIEQKLEDLAREGQTRVRLR